MSLEEHAQEEEISQKIERLVTRELIGKAQALFLVVNAVKADDDRVIERPAPGQALLF